MSDMNIDRFEDFFWYIIVSPHVFIEKISIQYFSFIFDKNFEKFIFFWWKFYTFPITSDQMFSDIDEEIFMLKNIFIFFLRRSYISSDDIFDTEKKFLKIKGFNEIVICTERKSLDAIDLFSKSREK